MGKGPIVLCLQLSTSMRGQRTTKLLRRMGYAPIVVNYGIGDSARLAKFSEVEEFIDLTRMMGGKKAGPALLHYRRLSALVGERKARMMIGQYLGLFPSGIKRALRHLSRRYDIECVHVLGYPDGQAISARRYLDLPIVFDFRDLPTGLSLGTIRKSYDNRVLKALHIDTPLARWNRSVLEEHELRALSLPSGVTFSSNEMSAYLQNKHGVDRSKSSLVIENRPFRDEIPMKAVSKLSDTEGTPHLVYIGALSSTGYRDTIPLFRNISRAGFDVHIYSTSLKEVVDSYRKGLSKDGKWSGTVHFHDPLPPEELHLEMMRYDYGLIPFDIGTDRLHMEYSIPNKLFEYLACGLRVISMPYIAMSSVIKKGHAGFTYDSSSDMTASLKRDWARRDEKTFKVEGRKWVIDEQLPRISRFFERTFSLE